MSTDTQKPIHVPYDWLKKASPEALAHDAIPLFGASPPFPWENFEEYLKNKLHIEDFEVSRSNITQKEADELLTGIGTPYRIQAITVSPLDANVLFVMSEQEIGKLLSSLLTTQESPLELEENFISPFFTFTVMEAIHAISKTGFDRTLVFNLDNTPQSPPATLCHVFNVNIRVHNTHIASRVIIPPEFRAAWKAYYSQKSLKVPVDPQLAESLEAVIQIEAGNLHMNLMEWKTVKNGDFLPLEHCTLEPSVVKGKVKLTLDGNLLFRGKLKDGNIKILENPLYHEDLTPMPNNKFNDEEENVDFSESDEDLGYDEDEEELTGTEESLEYDDDDDEDEDEELSEEEFSELENEEGERAVAEEEEEESFEEEPLRGTRDLSAGHPMRTRGLSHEHVLEKEPIQHRPLPSRKPLSPEEIPLDIVVEVGRIRMSIQKIMELQPGNLLELDLRPENGIDLVVNGEKIAKGELLLLGDHLGVCITDIG